MRIGLDYDETYTADPRLWSLFLQLCDSQGHEVIFVTRRIESERPVPKEHSLNCKVIYTENNLKRPFLANLGIQSPDIWIDDKPWEIGQ